MAVGRTSTALTLVAATLTILGCGTQTKKSGPVAACIPGEQQECPCPGNVSTGIQTCDDSGRFDECDCGAMLDVGMQPDGGMPTDGGVPASDMDVTDAETVDAGVFDVARGDAGMDAETVDLGVDVGEDLGMDSGGADMAVCGNGVLEAGEICDGDCPQTCEDNIACTTDELQGSAMTCDAVCMNDVIVDPIDGDGCCPTGATPNNDDDCVAVCGDGVVEGDETCDRAIGAGMTGSCPSSSADCDDMDSCTNDVRVGLVNDCTAECQNSDVMMPLANDGCCYFAGTVMQEINDCQTLCDEYCTAVTTYCTDAELGAGNALFTDDNLNGSAMDECQTACSQFQFTVSQSGSVDYVDDSGFDTMYCRLYHLALADPGQGGDPLVHCPHAVELSNPVCNMAP